MTGRQLFLAALVVIYKYVSLLRIDEREEQSDEGGLSRPRLTHNGRTRGGREVVVHLLHHGLLLGIVVVERHTLKTDATGGCYGQRLALLFLRIVLELHQTLSSREDTDESRSQTGDITSRALNAVHQLQEGSHAAKGQRAGMQAKGSPEEGNEIAQREAYVDEEMTDHTELRALPHPLAQHGLCTVEPSQHLVLGLHRLHQHAMLHGLGEESLDLAVGLAHLS